MKHLEPPKTSAHGFSLIEVVLSIGIVSLVVLSIFGFLAIATDTNRRAREGNSAAQLVQNEFERIRSLGSATFPVTWATRYYDASLNDLGTIPTSAAVYQLQIDILIPVAPICADRILNAEVRYPANSVAANQNVFRIPTLMNLPP
jgi:type II secretory pathway pseudopilin PulG